MKKKMLIVVLVSLSLALFFSTGHAKPFYDGKVIKLIVSTRPGGGYDFYGRMAARFMQKYLPGSTIIVKNIPGAGHVIGANTAYRSKPDGLTFGIYSVALPLSQVAGMKGVKFDLAKMSWLGAAAFTQQALFVSTNLPYRDLEGVKKAKKVRVACGGVGSFNYVSALLFAKMMGLDNFKLLTGYHGGEQQLALMRGEADATIMSYSTFFSFVRDGYAVPTVWFSNKQPKGFEDIPLTREVVTDPKYKPGAELLAGILSVERFFAGPPNIPPDRLEILRTAFKKAWHDPELLKMTQKANRPVRYTSGKDLEKLIKRILKQPPEMTKLLKTAYGLKN